MLPLRDENPVRTTPVVTWAIVAACIAAFLFWQPGPFSSTSADLEFNLRNAAIPCELVTGEPLTSDEIVATFQLGDDQACDVGDPASPPLDPGKNVWLAAVVSMFLHGSLLHIAGNMLFLWVFGNNIEDRLGHVGFALFYLAGGLAATAGHVLVDPSSTVPVVGASGAIAAVMGAYLVWYPDAPVRTLVIFFFITIMDIRAKWLLGFWFVLQFFTDPNDGVAWMAHVAGFAFGVLVALALRGFVRRPPARPLPGPTDGWYRPPPPGDFGGRY
ncbi:MAG: rhomboid family intramembrane serine protease [Acidimicrobiales bacterium]|nr:rhomboid family intramembrane serine protease [Acidimicrobiales bacterium]